jgi:hypothetical protein
MAEAVADFVGHTRNNGEHTECWDTGKSGGDVGVSGSAAPQTQPGSTTEVVHGSGSEHANTLLTR